MLKKTSYGGFALYWLYVTKSAKIEELLNCFYSVSLSEYSIVIGVF